MNYMLSGFQCEFISEVIEQLKIVQPDAQCKAAVYIPDDKFGAGHKIINGIQYFDRNCVRNVDGLEVGYADFGLDYYLPYFHHYASLLDRQIYDTSSLGGTHRYNLFTTLIGFYTEFFSNNKIDKIISREIPHFGSEFVMYLVAKNVGVDIVMFDFVEHLNRTLPIFDIYNRKIQSFNNDKHKADVENLLNKLGESFKDVQSKTAAPTFFNYQQKWSFFSWLKYIARDTYYVIKKNPFKIDHISLTKFVKGNLKSVSRFDVSFYFFRLRIKTFLLEKCYYSLSTNLDDIDDDNIVVFFSHYQPERTTNPDGGAYYDIIYTIRKLKSILPEKTTILYKEHPHIFSPTYRRVFRGGLLRNEKFYQDLIDMDVKLISIYEDNDKLFDKARAISSVTGTILLEAIAKLKPAIMFGNSWHVNIDPIIHIKNSEKIELSKLELTEKDLEQAVFQLCDIYENSVERLMLLHRDTKTTRVEVTSMLKILSKLRFFSEQEKKNLS